MTDKEKAAREYVITNFCAKECVKRHWVYCEDRGCGCSQAKEIYIPFLAGWDARQAEIDSLRQQLKEATEK